jgi:aspartate-semialdehyde dehydrogenase
MNERAGIEGERAYPYPIDLNVIPQIDVFLENGYTKEEMKMILETKKYLDNTDAAWARGGYRKGDDKTSSELLDVSEFCNKISLEDRIMIFVSN